MNIFMFTFYRRATSVHAVVVKVVEVTPEII